MFHGFFFFITGGEISVVEYSKWISCYMTESIPWSILKNCMYSLNYICITEDNSKGIPVNYFGNITLPVAVICELYLHVVCFFLSLQGVLALQVLLTQAPPMISSEMALLNACDFMLGCHRLSK